MVGEDRVPALAEEVAGEENGLYWAGCPQGRCTACWSRPQSANQNPGSGARIRAFPWSATRSWATSASTAVLNERRRFLRCVGGTNSLRPARVNHDALVPFRVDVGVIVDELLSRARFHTGDVEHRHQQL